MSRVSKIFGIILLFTLILSGAQATTIGELKSSITERESQIKAIEAEIEEYQKQIDENVSKANTLKSEIKRLETVLKKLNADLRLTQKKINASELTLEKLSLEIGDTTSSITSKEKALGATLQALYEGESDSLLEVLLRHGKLSDFFAGAEYIENLESAVNADRDVLIALEKDLQERKQEEETQKNKQELLKSELEDRRAVQQNISKSKSQLLAATKNKEAEYQKIVREREKKRAEILDGIRKIEDELRLLVDPASLPSPRSGVLAWPTANPKLTQGFGKNTFASSHSDVYGRNGHNGIDLRASIGTPILAAEDGRIKSTGSSDTICPGGSYGRWILIEHSNHLATLYAHLSLIRISTGEEVKKGQVIGYSGDTGYTTGPHLHFTVYDARTVELRSSRVCGILPYGGYLDPLIYL
ncbi:MAG: peptidoglycan DD-metalloendopeptidase family protein [bacterium]|nr:peptidoglycan DD-metalloendopeptidase family protein [bacterium]